MKAGPQGPAFLFPGSKTAEVAVVDELLGDDAGRRPDRMRCRRSRRPSYPEAQRSGQVPRAPAPPLRAWKKTGLSCLAERQGRERKRRTNRSSSALASGRAALLRRPIFLDARQRVPTDGSVAVVLGLVRAVRGHSEVFGLRLGELGQHDADLLEMQAGDLLVQLLGQAIDGFLVLVLVLPEVQLRERLVG